MCKSLLNKDATIEEEEFAEEYSWVCCDMFNLSGFCNETLYECSNNVKVSTNLYLEDGSLTNVSLTTSTKLAFAPLLFCPSNPKYCGLNTEITPLKTNKELYLAFIRNIPQNAVCNYEIEMIENQELDQMDLVKV